MKAPAPAALPATTLVPVPARPAVAAAADDDLGIDSAGAVHAE
jgi:hypothetical protein